MWLKAIAQYEAHVILDVYTCAHSVKPMCYEFADDRRQPGVGQGHL